MPMYYVIVYVKSNNNYLSQVEFTQFKEHQCYTTCCISAFYYSCTRSWNWHLNVTIHLCFLAETCQTIVGHNVDPPHKKILPLFWHDTLVTYIFGLKDNKVFQLRSSSFIPCSQQWNNQFLLLCFPLTFH